MKRFGLAPLLASTSQFACRTQIIPLRSDTTFMVSSCHLIELKLAYVYFFEGRYCRGTRTNFESKIFPPILRIHETRFRLVWQPSCVDIMKNKLVSWDKVSFEFRWTLMVDTCGRWLSIPALKVCCIETTSAIAPSLATYGRLHPRIYLFAACDFSVESTQLHLDNDMAPRFDLIWSLSNILDIGRILYVYLHARSLSNNIDMSINLRVLSCHSWFLSYHRVYGSQSLEITYFSHLTRAFPPLWNHGRIRSLHSPPGKSRA